MSDLSRVDESPALRFPPFVSMELTQLEAQEIADAMFAAYDAKLAEIRQRDRPGHTLH
jgi:hypothetical protein